MSDVDHARRAAVCHAVLGYLARHPRASDTAAGIATWWLREEGVRVTQALLEEALESLVAEGTVVRRSLPDGTVLYAAPADGKGAG